MGGCCSKSTATTTTPAPPIDQQSDLKSQPPPPEKKKEIFVIKHRISHDSSSKDQEIDDNDENFNLVLQCGSGSGSRLSRSNSSTGPQNPNRKRRSSRSNSSFDFDLNTRFNNLYYHHDDNDDDDHRAGRARGVSTSRNSSISRSNSKERRISISPSRTTRTRSESPFRRNPLKMVSVPATNKTCNSQEEGVLVKRIHVKRNVSPAKTRSAAGLRVFNDQHQTNTDTNTNTNTREVDQLYYTRKSLVEIDNNAATSTQLGKRARKLSRDMNPETFVFDPSPGPPSYASLLLEDIHKFHQNNPNAAASTAPPAFALPECVTKARSIMEAVADLNSNTSSEDRYRNLTMIEHQIKPIESGTVVDGVSSASAFGDQQPISQAEPTSQDLKVRGLGGFRKDFMDYPREQGMAVEVLTRFPKPQLRL